MSGDGRFCKVAENPSSNHYVVGDTGVFWDHFDLPIAASFNPHYHPYILIRNLTQSLGSSKKLFGFMKLFYYCDEEPASDDALEEFEKARFFTYSEMGGDDDPVSKSFRAKRMVADLLFWALDKRNCRTDDEPANLLIVSNNISDQPELVNVLKSLELDGFNILLVQSDKKEEKPDDIPTESFDWLWKSIMEGEGSHVGHQSGSSQGNDACSMCGNDVPEFSDICSICAKEKEALDKEEEALAKEEQVVGLHRLEDSVF